MARRTATPTSTASCELCVSVDLSIGFATNGSGNASINMNFPNNTGLINSLLYTQAAIVDIGPGRQSRSCTATVQTKIGGNV